jgi:hypothetical protein
MDISEMHCRYCGNANGEVLKAALCQSHDVAVINTIRAPQPFTFVAIRIPTYIDIIKNRHHSVLKIQSYIDGSTSNRDTSLYHRSDRSSAKHLVIDSLNFNWNYSALLAAAALSTVVCHRSTIDSNVTMFQATTRAPSAR